MAQALYPHGWAITSGDYGGVGVGGLATAGGIGFLAREHGLTIDHIRAVEMVLADGLVVRADEHHHPDLFWGVRGAGSALGIVTSFEFEADEVGLLGFAQFRSVGGAVADVPPEATAYAHRSANFSAVTFGAGRHRLDAA